MVLVGAHPPFKKTGGAFFIFIHKGNKTMAVPIWKDTRVLVGSGSYADYQIRLENGPVIFNGRAFPLPGATTIYVTINEICADYMAHTIPNYDGETTPLAYEKTFVIQRSGLTNNYTFRNDWSYDKGFNPDIMGLSFPIDGRVDRRQTLLYTEKGDSEMLDILVQYGGPRPDFRTLDFNSDFLISEEKSTVQYFADNVTGYRVFSLVLDAQDWANEARSITIGKHTWQVIDCAEYVLHYINAYGGWDSLLVAGNGKATDSIKHYETGIAAINSSYNAESRRTKRNYVNNLTRKYTFHTGVLTEEQSSRMYHLLESPMVFLQILDEGTQWYPVILTGNTCEFKTYRNNGNKLMEYTIEAELAENRMRR